MPEVTAPALTVDRRRGETWVRATVDVERPADELFHFWSNPLNLPRFVGGLRSVERTGPAMSRWTTGAEGAVPTTWCVHQVANEAAGSVRWSCGGGAAGAFASVRCQPMAGGERSRLDWSVRWPAGGLAEALWGSDPETTVRADASRFAGLMRPHDDD